MGFSKVGIHGQLSDFREDGIPSKVCTKYEHKGKDYFHFLVPIIYRYRK